MKKFVILFFIILAMPAFAAVSEYQKCEIDVQSDIFSMWSFDKDKVPAKYKDMVTLYGNETVNVAYNGNCVPGGAFSCNVGQIRKDCDICWGLTAERKAEEKHVQDVAAEKCAGKSTTQETPDAANTADNKATSEQQNKELAAQEKEEAKKAKKQQEAEDKARKENEQKVAKETECKAKGMIAEKGKLFGWNCVDTPETKKYISDVQNAEKAYKASMKDLASKVKKANKS